MVFAATLALSAPVCVADDDPETHDDDRGDAVIRRTDLGNDGLLGSGITPPDLLRVVVGGWVSPTPTTNPYAGSWIDPRDTDLLRIDVVFNGLVGPPGPINLQGEGFDPFRYSPNPVYGFVEFDLDREKDTGGEIDNVWNRPLGAASRFGGRLSGSVGDRAPDSAWSFDGEETRSGEEMHLSLCGCQSFTVNPLGDPTPNSFDAGDQWILNGRFLQRTHAFIDYSFAFGGSESGAYDPKVNLRISHNASRDETTFSLVYGITMSGAARLTGQAQQSIDLNANNHTSMHEMLSEIRFAAVNANDPGWGTSFDLLREWRDSNHSDVTEFLDPTRWEVLTLFGSPYAVEQSDAQYVWTDVGPKFEYADLNGDSRVNSIDQGFVSSAIASSDGTAIDADGMVNGQTLLDEFAYRFALYDLDYDGFIGSLDMAILGYAQLGDVNSDRAINGVDLQLLEAMLGFTQGDPRFNPAADLNDDDVIDSADRTIMRQLLGFGASGARERRDLVEPPRRRP
ncbi:MAG: dockerin type I domain-containing protein [Phycisphaerales bacterium]